MTVHEALERIGDLPLWQGVVVAAWLLFSAGFLAWAGRDAAEWAHAQWRLRQWRKLRRNVWGDGLWGDGDELIQHVGTVDVDEDDDEDV